MLTSIKKFLKKSKISKDLLLALSTVLLILIPVYPKFPLFFVNGERVAIRLDDLVVAFSFFVFLFLDWQDGFKTLKSPFARLVYFFFFALTLSTLNSFLIGHDTPNFLIALLHLLRRIEYFTVFFVIKKSLEIGKTKDQIVWPSLIALILVAIYGLGQKFLSWPVISTMNEEFSKGLLLQMSIWTRINSTFAGHYDLAVYLSLILTFLPTYAISQKKILKKIPLIFIWILSFYILVLTSSRVSFVAAFLGAFLAFIFTKRYFWIPFLILINIAGVLLSPDLNQRLLATYSLDIQKTLPVLEEFITQKLSFLKPKKIVSPPAPVALVPVLPVEPTPFVSLPSPTPITIIKATTGSADLVWPKEDITAAAQRSGDIRFKVEWPRSINALKKHPFLGTGPSSITLATDNDYLRVLGETGILGFLSWILPFIYLAKRSIFILKKKNKQPNDYLIAGLFLTIITMFLNATLIDVFEASKIAYLFWILMAIMVHLLDKDYAQN